MPTLQRTAEIWFWNRIGSERSAITLRATVAASSSLERFVSSSANSSPPRRQAVSLSRRHAVIRRAGGEVACPLTILEHQDAFALEAADYRGAGRRPIEAHGKSRLSRKGLGQARRRFAGELLA